MRELIDRMLKQFDEMKAIAESSASMANQALDERNAARKALRDASGTLQSVLTGLQGMTTAQFNFGADRALRMRLNAEIEAIRAILEPKP